MLSCVVLAVCLQSVAVAQVGPPAVVPGMSRIQVESALGEKPCLVVLTGGINNAPLTAFYARANVTVLYDETDTVYSVRHRRVRPAGR
ncbi:MAG: hypothetical protein K2X87_01395 [Gemmataceae bacterium]|nr:hypothetical protein [Gemmataceae bacterium]